MTATSKGDGTHFIYEQHKTVLGSRFIRINDDIAELQCREWKPAIFAPGTTIASSTCAKYKLEYIRLTGVILPTIFYRDFFSKNTLTLTIYFSRLIDFTGNRTEHPMFGYFYTGLLFVCTIVQTMACQHYFHRMFIVGARVRTALTGLIYRKVKFFLNESTKDNIFLI